MLKKLRSHLDKKDAAFKEWAEEKGFLYDGELVGSTPSVLMAGNKNTVCRQVLTTREEPLVEFGNHGLPYIPGYDDMLPHRMGYIAVKHNLQLPHFILEFPDFFGSWSVLNLSNGLFTALSMFDENRSTEPYSSPLTAFRSSHIKIDVSAPHRFMATAVEKDVEAAKRLIFGPASEIFDELTKSFSVEVQSGWIHIYNHFGDASTQDEEVWQWITSAASRVLELLNLLQEEWPLKANAEPLNFTTAHFYTEKILERPKKLDGRLSFLKRKN